MKSYCTTLFSYLDFISFGLESLFDGFVQVATGVDDEKVLGHLEDLKAANEFNKTLIFDQISLGPCND